MPFYLRKAFARFRCSSHKFAIETGRHRDIGRLDRICLYCLNHWDRLVVEDEYHVFFICAKYNNVREEYLYSWYQSGDSKNHFYNILSTSDHILIKKLCIYINELLKHNDSILNI